jgi:hypothetical protein
MRVHPGQTLILAGDPLPKRSAAASNGITSVSSRNSPNSQRVTYFSARFDAVVTDAEFTPSANVPDTNEVANDATDVGDNDAALPATLPKTSSALTSRPYSAYASSSRGSSFGGANAYARTQDLSERHPIIDTYA